MQISAASQATANAPERFTDANLSTDAFLTLLITQLRSQNPLEPMDPNEFVAQLAQFNSLSQLIEIRQLLQESNAAAATTRSEQSASAGGIGSSTAAAGD